MKVYITQSVRPGWVGTVWDTGEDFTHCTGTCGVGGTENPTGRGREHKNFICAWEALQKKKKTCWQLQTPQSVCAFSESPSPSRTACEFQSRPGPGFNWIFFKRSVLSNKYITFETLFHNKLIPRSSWMPYCVLKRKKRIPDSQNIFNKHFREFPPPPETPN